MSEQPQEFIQQASQAVQAGQFAHALALVEQALAINPQLADAYILQGIILAQTQQPDAATAAFRQGIALSPMNPKAYYNLATHLYQQNQKDEAQAMAEESIRLDPQHSAAKDLVALIQQERSVARQPIESPSPQPTAGSPYGSSQPYAPPQSPYYRPGYEQQPAHSLAFVENMGSNWVVIGWAAVLMTITAFFLSIVIALPMMEELSRPDGLERLMQMTMGNMGPMSIVANILSYGGVLLGLVWIIMDLVDRRGNFLWLVPFVLCCCCGMAFAPLAVYLVAGRK